MFKRMFYHVLQLESCERWEDILKPFVDADDESPDDKAKKVRCWLRATYPS